MAKNVIHISTPQRTYTNGVWRVSADVAGEPLWFESKDSKLAVVPEAFVSALFIPALHTGSKLTIDAKVDAGWIENTRNLLPIYKDWWGYPAEHPVETASDNRQPHAKNKIHNTKAASSALCFTDGADSFYSLLRGSNDPRFLLYVRGFDVSLTDEERYLNFKKSLDEITKATGTSSIIISTNLRLHPTFKKVNWERTHGAALASVGLLLSNVVNALVIPSSKTLEDEKPWGSHWKTDHFWSLPGTLELIHADAELNRIDKILAIAENSLVQKHLRVCWENRAQTGNCSRCEKCLRTMTSLEESGQLARYHRVFDTQTPLTELLNKLRYVPPHLHHNWKILASRNLPKEVLASIQELLTRKKPAPVRKKFQFLRKVFNKVRRSISHRLFSATDKS